MSNRTAQLIVALLASVAVFALFCAAPALLAVVWFPPSPEDSRWQVWTLWLARHEVLPMLAIVGILLINLLRPAR